MSAAAIGSTLAACGASQHDRPSSAAPGTEAIETRPRDVPSRLRVVVEAWPAPAAGVAGPHALVDGRLDTRAYEPAADVPLPYDIVLAVSSGPAAVAAIGLHLSEAPGSPLRVEVYTYLGAVPLTRAGFLAFVERSELQGVADLTGVAGIFELPAAASAHYVRLRFWAAAPGIAELSVYNAAQLAGLRDGGVEIQPLRPEQAAALEVGEPAESFPTGRW